MLRPQLRIETPAGRNIPGRGFYQLEEDALQAQVGFYPDSRRFFSYLESDFVRFDIDRSGRLILIEVTCPRRSWQTDENLAPPSIAEPADIRWLDFRAVMPEPELIGNRSRDQLLIRFSAADSWRWFTVANGLFVQVDRDHRLLALIVTGIVDDFAGRELASFRRQISLVPNSPGPDRRRISTISG